MAEPVLLDNGWPLGFKTDISRENLPRGAAARMIDALPAKATGVLPEGLVRRGSWKRATSALSALGAAPHIKQATWCPWGLANQTPYIIAIGAPSGGAQNAFKCPTYDGVGTGQALIGSVGAFAEPGTITPPVFHKNKLIVLPATDDSALVKKITDAAGTPTIANLGGTPPTGCFAVASWGEYLLLANGIDSTRFKGRIWVSGVGNDEIWDKVNAFADMPEEVVAIMPLKNLIVVFGWNRCWAITGDVPPPKGNWRRFDIGAQGTTDPRSVIRVGEEVIFANPQGIFKTDGQTIVDLTKRGGISTYWRYLTGILLEYTSAIGGLTISAGFHRGHLFVSYTNAVGTTMTTLIANLEENAWAEATNIRAAAYTRRGGVPQSGSGETTDELFWASRGDSYVNRAKYMLEPRINSSADTGLDGNGLLSLPEIQTRFYTLQGRGKKRIRKVYLTYYLPEKLGGAPLTVVQTRYMLTPTDTDFQASGVPNDLPVNLKMERREISINRRSEGIGLRLTVPGEDSGFALASIEIEGHNIEGSR